METITTDVIIRGPATCGRTGATYYEAWLPLRSPAQEYIKGTPCASGPTPYAAMKSLASKYPWSKEGGPLVSLEFAGPVADKIILDYHTCEDCGKDEREDQRHGGHYFMCEATEAGRAGRAMWAEEAAKERLADAAPDLLAALKHMVMVYTLTSDHIDGHAPDAECCLCEAHRAIAKATAETESCPDCGGTALRLDTTTGAVDCVDCGGE